ncbi:MAG TPA: iron-sulfur cluster assembly accessory protein [Gammaproteobacteria bacterium]|nr:iron-sulfur cluster assembly accessory protein [Gammaproteobacteria bacterium]
MTEVTAEQTATGGFVPTLTEADVSLTSAARSKLAELFTEADEDLQGIRIFVSGGGCGGMSYGMTFTDQNTDYDCVLEDEAFKLYVDAVALNFLRGVEIDFVERDMGASFVFNNVFAATGGSGTCSACGAAGGGCA